MFIGLDQNLVPFRDHGRLQKLQLFSKASTEPGISTRLMIDW